ncbi:rubrerythrin-like domain-containing protein [Halovivax sp.]|nr:rubrerythrin-like domain-containing protein [Halovivax sp.]
MRDVTYDPEDESTFECFRCGTRVSDTSPSACPDCGSEMRSQRTPLE